MYKKSEIKKNKIKTNNLSMAYIISCYKLPEQVVDLVEKLGNSNSFFLIHIDKNSSREYANYLKNKLEKYENVTFIRRHRCYWGDYGHVRATLKAIRYLIDNHIRFDYFNVITGQDLPIKSTNKINSFFINKTKSYMDYFPLPNSAWKEGGMDRIDNLHIQLRNKNLILPKKLSKLVHAKFLKLRLSSKKDFNFFGGSGYFSLNRIHVKYIYDFLSQNKDYEKFFKYSYISDEIFFHTILLNSKFKNEIINNNLRLIDWSGPSEYPKIFRKDDFTTIKNSKALFARKFDSSIDNEIIAKIDLLLQ